jgi:thiamine pyrophosphate-dependent acetolactate synthase large subunit-like protein
VTGTTFGSIDYAKLGAAFGIEAKVITTAAECRDALRVRPTDRPALVAARIDPSAYRIG